MAGEYSTSFAKASDLAAKQSSSHYVGIASDSGSNLRDSEPDQGVSDVLAQSQLPPGPATVPTALGSP
jgi:hypothetical protein